MSIVDTSKYRDDDQVNLREAAAILNVSESTFARYREDGKFPYIKYSKRKIFYLVKDLRQFKEKSYVIPETYLE